MKDTFAYRKRVSAFWKARGLASIIAELIAKLGARQVEDFLSGSYRGAVPGLETMLPTGCQYQPHPYPGLGSGSDHHRGLDLRRLLAG